MIQGMEFPLLDVLDDEQSIAWLEQHFHPNGLACPHCRAGRDTARFFRMHSGRGLPVWRCHPCQGLYHLYRGTVVPGRQ